MRPKQHRLWRAIRFWWQRRTRGFDDSITWSLDYSMAKWMLPRLKVYRKFADKYLDTKCEDEDMTHVEMVDEIIFAFEKEVETDGAIYILDEKETERAFKGWELFGKYVQTLWW